jgi:anti-sigma regulatory factor (Ser/Thr protein kinase)
MEAFEASLRLDLSLLRGLRRQLQSWLAQIGVPDDAAEDVVLATHEAAANAIEHAEFGTEVTIRGTRDDDQLIVAVTNTGPWKRPRSMDESRGRGLVLMENLMSEVHIRARSKVTTVRMCKDLSPREARSPTERGEAHREKAEEAQLGSTRARTLDLQ